MRGARAFSHGSFCSLPPAPCASRAAAFAEKSKCPGLVVRGGRLGGLCVVMLTAYGPAPVGHPLHLSAPAPLRLPLGHLCASCTRPPALCWWTRGRLGVATGGHTGEAGDRGISDRLPGPETGRAVRAAPGWGVVPGRPTLSSQGALPVRRRSGRQIKSVHYATSLPRCPRHTPLTP